MTIEFEPLGKEFDSPRQLVARARHHIEDFNAKAAAAITPENFEMFSTPDGLGGNYIKLRYIGSIPSDLSFIVNDCAYNLRSALDHAMYASAVTIRGGDPRRTKFPFGETKAAIESDIARGDCKHNHADIIDLVLNGFKPYEQGGNPVLWAINRLRNRNTHRALVPTAAISGLERALVETKAENSATADFMTGPWDYVKNEMLLIHIVGTETRMKIEINGDISLHGLPGFEAEPAADVLSTFAGEVERILMAIEAETARLVTT